MLTGFGARLQCSLDLAVLTRSSRQSLSTLLPVLRAGHCLVQAAGARLTPSQVHGAVTETLRGSASDTSIFKNTEAASVLLVVLNQI